MEASVEETMYEIKCKTIYIYIYIFIHIYNVNTQRVYLRCIAEVLPPQFWQGCTSPGHISSYVHSYSLSIYVYIIIYTQVV